MLENLLNKPPPGPIIPEVPGTPYEGGYYVGRMDTGTGIYALVLAPRDKGQSPNPVYWKTSATATANTSSLIDGWANTQAMVAAGIDLHPAAKFCRGLSIGGFTDWYLPSISESEMCYRQFKPTTAANSILSSGGPQGPMGLNVYSIPASPKYTTTDPGMTTNPLFQSGGSEAFDKIYYLSSTQNSVTKAWYTVMNSGLQDKLFGKTDDGFYVRAVRRVRIV
jgi:hypothetical protein